MTAEEYAQKLAAKDLEIRLLHTAIDKSNEALECAVVYKEALEKILNIRVQDKQIVDAWKEARQIAFDAFTPQEEGRTNV